MDETRQIANLLEQILEDDHFWKYPSPLIQTSILYRWRLEMEPIIEDLREIARRINGSDSRATTDKLIQQRRHATREKYARIYDWATRFDSFSDLHKVWNEIKA